MDDNHSLENMLIERDERIEKLESALRDSLKYIERARDDIPEYLANARVQTGLAVDTIKDALGEGNQ